MILLIFAAGVTNKFGSGLSPSPLPSPSYDTAKFPSPNATAEKYLLFGVVLYLFPQQSEEMLIILVAVQNMKGMSVKPPCHRP